MRLLVSAVSLPLRSGHSALLDGWRGLCILLVLVGHFFRSVEPLAGLGVEFFFVLSGRLMADILVFKRQDVRTFAIRRFARVVPALAAYVLIAGAVVELALLLDGSPTRLASPLAALFFVHNYLPLSAVVSSFEHSWSLAVEEHSYLTLIGIVLLAGRRPRLAAALALGIALLAFFNGIRLAAQWPAPDGQFYLWRTDARIASVLFSFGLHILLRPVIDGTRAPLLGWAAPAALAAAVALALALPNDDPLGWIGMTMSAALAVNMLAVSPQPLRALLERPALLWFGTLSFSIYLWQQLFFVFTHGALPAPVAVLATIGCALWSFKRIEDPARDYLNARWGRERELPGFRRRAALRPG